MRNVFCHRELPSGCSLLLIVLMLQLSMLLASCSDDDDAPYPNIVTEMADLPTNSDGVAATIVLDDNRTLDITNRQTGLAKDSCYRVLAGYVESGGTATLYSLALATVLADSSSVVRHDPVKVLSAWRKGRYINLHLAPLTQGGRQYWGYSTIAQSEGHRHLSLHHNQNGDPLSYTTDVYLSIPVDVDERVTFNVQTSDGVRIFEF